MDGSFEEWVRGRSTSLLRAAFLLTGSQPAAEDLVQSTLEKVAGAWGRIEEYPDAYARRIMYRLEMRQWQRRRRQSEVAKLRAASVTADPADQVDARVVVGEALRRITTAQRAVLVLRYFEDLSEADAAHILGCSVGTVKSQTHKALNALRVAAPELAALVEKEVAADA